MNTSSPVDMQFLRSEAASYREKIPAETRDAIAAVMPAGQTLDFYMGAYFISSRDAILVDKIPNGAGRDTFTLIALANGYFADAVVRMLGDDSKE